VVALDAYGYGVVAEHPEQIFTDAVVAEDFVRQSGGRLGVCVSSRGHARAEILLPRNRGNSAVVSGRLRRSREIVVPRL
jgi:hypothetical protein